MLDVGSRMATAMCRPKHRSARIDGNVAGTCTRRTRQRRPAERGPYQFVAVEASISPTDASQRSASMAALQPSPAAVTACR